jgi:hypothetical protein
MQRVKRRLRNFSDALSLLALLATCFLWARSARETNNQT